MSQPAAIDAPEKSDDVICLQKQIADLLRKNQSLEQENEKLSKRFGLVWPEQPEFFVQVISDTEVVYQNGLYRRVGALETNGSKARLDFDGSDESEDLKRGDSPYLYTGKQSSKTYLGNGGIAYEWRKFINEDYLPTLVKKGSGFGFDDKNGQRKNLLIEGDNYHALQVLQHTHRGAIDVIYIDPPYNTGNKDFKYNDRFVAAEDGGRHSSWLSFMERRLKLARELMSGSGVLVVSIDENEQARLEILLEKIFGPNNVIGCLPTIMNMKGNQDQFGFAGTHEFTFFVAKDVLQCEINNLPVRDCNELKKWEQDGNGYFKEGANLKASGVDGAREKRPNLYFPIYVSEREEVSLERKPGFVEVLPISDGREMRWRWSRKKFKDNLSELIVKKTPSGYSIYKKQRPKGGVPSVKQKSLMYRAEYSSGNGTAELKSLFGDKINITPKPLSLIKDLVLLSSKKESTVLDFFAGSGTTGHAVWDLNSESDERTFILVTNNESNICEEVTYERLRRCNLPEHGNYQQGLEYLQLKHVAETEVDGYNMATSFEHIKQVVNVRFGSFNVIEETDDWYITDKIAVLKNYVKYPAFFEKYGKHAAYGLVTKKERQAQTFRSEASKRVSIDDIHVFNKEYLNDLYRVVREDMA